MTLDIQESLQKYQAAAGIANEALKHVLSLVKESADIKEICAAGDKFIKMSLETIQGAKGVAFPTCLSVNNVICHFCPTTSILLNDGDVVKVELGVHVDGFPAIVGQTVVVGKSNEEKDNLLSATFYASQAAIRVLKEGNTNMQITDAVAKICKDYGVTAIEGCLSFQVDQDTLDGEKSIILNPTEAQRKSIETVNFEVGEVYVLDIAVSTGEGKMKSIDKPFIFKKNKASYQLKLKTSRAVFSEVSKKFGCMAFKACDLEDERRGRVGLHECVTHRIVTSYEVLTEKEHALVARYLATIVVTESGPLVLTSFESPPSIVDKLSPEMKILVSESTSK